MSRAYWVKLSESVCETISASDKTTHKIELENILPASEMQELTGAALEEEGWVKQEDGTYQRNAKDGVILIWDLESMTVEAHAEAARDVSRDIEVKGRGYAQETAQQDAERELARRKEAVQEGFAVEKEVLQSELSAKLDTNQDERVREINGVLQRTYAEALKRKARQLGNVTSIHESKDGDDYQLTITIAE